MSSTGCVLYLYLHHFTSHSFLRSMCVCVCGTACRFFNCSFEGQIAVVRRNGCEEKLSMYQPKTGVEYVSREGVVTEKLI